MTLLEQLPKNVQIEVANDMLVNIPKIIERDLDRFVNIMSDTNPRVYRRWYDFDPALHSAIEAMQNLTFEQRNELILSISDILFTSNQQGFDKLMDNFSQKEKIDFD